MFPFVLCLQLVQDSRSFQELFDKAHDFLEDGRLWPVDALQGVEKLEKLEVFKEMMYREAEGAGPRGMAVLSGKVTVPLERLSAITNPPLFKDLSDDEKAEATLSYEASFAGAWKRIFCQYRHEAEDASKLRECFWE